VSGNQENNHSLVIKTNVGLASLLSLTTLTGQLSQDPAALYKSVPKSMLCHKLHFSVSIMASFENSICGRISIVF